eukprot:1444336-Prymnesium_polylepis.2
MSEAVVNIGKALEFQSYTAFQGLGMACGGFGVGFYKDVATTLVIMAFLPVVLLFLGCFAAVLIGGAKVRMKAYSGAGGVAQEALYAMRTVSALGIESSLQQRYTSLLAAASQTAMKIAPIQGFTTGLAFSCFVILQAQICLRKLFSSVARSSPPLAAFSSCHLAPRDLET